MLMQPLTDEVITPEMEEIRAMIVSTVTKRNSLKCEMEDWYEIYPSRHFPKMKTLIVTDSTLSKLDTYYKKLWDFNNQQTA